MSDWLAMLPASGNAAVQAGTVLLLAALGELVAERAGVLNLGLEGVLLCGALAGFAASRAGESAWLGVVAAGLVGLALGLLHGLVTVGLGASQVVAGLALMILGTGLTGFLGRPLIGQTAAGLPLVPLPGLVRLPLVGPIFFRQDALAYASYAAVPLVALLLNRTRWGLALRAIGEDPVAADARGLPVRRVRLAAVAFGGLMAGLAGAHLSLACSRMWIERMAAGRGWIALAVVIFAGWRPLRALAGAYLFGAVTALAFRLQAVGLTVSAPLLQTAPYLATLAGLALISRRRRRGEPVGPPAALTIPFHREERT